MSTRTSAACCTGTSRWSAARTSIAVSLLADGSASRLAAAGQRVQRFVVPAGRGRARCPAAHAVQGGINNNPVQPGRDGRVAPKAIGFLERRDHRILQSVGCLLRIAECTDGNGPEPVPMPPEQLAERIGIARHVPPEQISVRRTLLLVRSFPLAGAARAGDCAWTRDRMDPSLSPLGRSTRAASAGRDARSERRSVADHLVAGGRESAGRTRPMTRFWRPSGAGVLLQLASKARPGSRAGP